MPEFQETNRIKPMTPLSAKRIEFNRLICRIVKFDPLKIVEIVRRVVENLVDDHLGMKRKR